MEKRKLGHTNIEVAPLCFGGNVFGWTVDEETSFALLDAFVDEGFGFIDTADVYSRWKEGNSGGESETIIGNWLARSGKRDRVVIATKLGMDLGEGKQGLSAKYMVQAVEASLRRLQTDHIDLYQAHRDDAATELDETLEAFGRLIAAGKVRAIGASNYDADRLRQAAEVSRTRHLPRYDTLQPLYNLYDRKEFEAELLPLCVEEKISVIPYFSLASGFLTGKYRSEADAAGKSRGERVKKYLNPRGMRILDALDEVAAAQDATPAEVALAWLAGRPTIAAPIASATTLEQLQTLTRSVRLKLHESSLARLMEASAEA